VPLGLLKTGRSCRDLHHPAPVLREGDAIACVANVAALPVNLGTEALVSASTPASPHLTKAAGNFSFLGYPLRFPSKSAPCAAASR
jgi:hypothetical protein